MRDGLRNDYWRRCAGGFPGAHDSNTIVSTTIFRQRTSYLGTGALVLTVCSGQRPDVLSEAVAPKFSGLAFGERNAFVVGRTHASDDQLPPGATVKLSGRDFAFVQNLDGGAARTKLMTSATEKRGVEHSVWTASNLSEFDLQP